MGDSCVGVRRQRELSATGDGALGVEHRGPTRCRALACHRTPTHSLLLLLFLLLSCSATTLQHGRFQIATLHMPKRFEDGDDGGDFFGAFLRLAGETSGKGLGVLADGGQELAHGGHLGRSLFGPGLQG